MIADTVEELTPLVGTRPACRALGAAPATIYRRRTPPAPRPARPPAPSPRALSDAEREAVLGELHSERFVDCSPAQVYATLLDEGTYLASQRTMYRVLAAEHGGVRERRDQLQRPAYAAPELLAERPNEVYSWDITKLKGPAKWSYFYLYVINPCPPKRGNSNRTYGGDDPNKGTEAEGAFGGQWSGPLIVLTHDSARTTQDSSTTLVGDLSRAVAAATDAAGGKYANVLGADVAGQCIEAGVLDEVLVFIAPVLLGDGVRLFARPGGTNVCLEQLDAPGTGSSSGLWFRVAR